MQHQLLSIGIALLTAVAGGSGGPLDQARDDLGSPNRERRASAVRRLATLDLEPAWRLVVGALGDPEGSVAEVAEEVLGRSRSPYAAGSLAGRQGLGSSDARIAARAARALGRSSSPPPVRALLRAAGSRDEDVRSASLWAIERTAAAGRWPAEAKGFDELARLLRRGPSDRVRARALLALTSLDADRAGPLVRAALGDRHEGLRAAACEPAVRLLAAGERWELLRERLDDPAWRVRLAALDAAVTLAVPRVVPALIERMESDPRRRLRHRALLALRELSGLRHGEDPRPWHDWAATLEKRELPAVSDGRRSAGRGERSVALERVTIDSDHVAFLIDLSGSMWARHGSHSRKEVVNVRFGALLDRLAPDTRFLLVPFASQPFPWKEEPVPASPRNVAKARRYFDSCTRRGSGDLWEAALLALEQDEIDTLVVLTDGVPTGGEYNRMDLLSEAFAERNQSRRVTVDALLIQASGRSLRAWTRFCASTGGRCTPVDLGG